MQEPRIVVTLKRGVSYTEPGGGGAFGGETISVPKSVGERLLRNGLATDPNARVVAKPVAGAVENRVTKVEIPSNYRGAAAIGWLKKELLVRGIEPQGSSVEELRQELAAVLENENPGDENNNG